MKKLVYIAAIAFAASMVACGGHKTEAPAVDSDSIKAAEAAALAATTVVGVDTVVVDEVAMLQQTYQDGHVDTIAIVAENVEVAGE